MSKLLIDNNVEIYNNHITNTIINVFNNDIKQYDISNISYYNLKGKFNGKFVTLSTENILDEELLLNMLISKSKIIDNTDDGSFASEEIVSTRCIIEKDDNEEIIKFLKDLYSLKNKYKDIYTINSFYTRTDSDISIENKNIKSVDKRTSYSYSFEIIVKHGDKTYDDFLNIVDIKLDLDKVYKKVEECIEKIYLRFNSAKIKTDKYNVLLTNDVVNKILNQFMDMFSARNIKDKLSPLSDKYNEKIFSDKITFIEDPLNNDFFGTRFFDSEGTKTSKKVIVENGKFINKLYDNSTAKTEGVKSTGNSFGVRNLYIKPGDKTFNELENMLDNTVVITNVEGTHSGINIKSGDISVQARGYIFDEGVKKSVELIILSTNLFEMLSNVVDISNELVQYSGNILNPALLLKDINITVGS